MNTIMNSLCVAKFGGTSMAHAVAMRQSATIVLRDTKIKIVVVSATSGTTNQLIEIYHHWIDNQQLQSLELLESVQKRHSLIAKELSATLDRKSVV